MKFKLFFVSICLLASCGHKDSNQDNQDGNQSPKPGKNIPLTTTSYQDVKAVIDSNCATCHSPQGRMKKMPMTTFDEVAAVRDDMASEISGGDMPPRDSTFGQTTDGQKLLEWLTSHRN